MKIICRRCNHEGKTLSEMSFKVNDRMRNINLLAEIIDGIEEEEKKAIVAESIVPSFVCPKCGAHFFLSVTSENLIVTLE